MPYSKDSKQRITEICSDIQSNIDLKEDLVKAALFRGEEDDYLFMDVHHLAVDGVSWRVISSDLELAYSQLLKGEEVKLPDKTNNYNDYAEALEKYRNSYKLEKEISYWEKVQSKLMKLPVSEEKDYSRKFARIDVVLDAEKTKKFTTAKFTAINGNINDALLTAVCRSYKNVFGESCVSIQFEGHGREDIGVDIVTDRTVGWFTSIYPVVVENISGEIGKDLLNVKENMRRVPNKGVGYNILRFIEGKHKVNFATGKIAKIGFNYLGEIGAEQQEEGLLSGSDIDTGASVSKKNVFGPDLSVNCVVSEGCFSLLLDYNTALTSADQAKMFADGILREMQVIAGYLSELKEQTVTASDLGETVWSMEEFDRTVADFASRGESIQRIYPLTSMQEGMLLEYMSDPHSWAYKIVMAYEINRVLSEKQLEKVLERLARKHEVLRTAFIYDGVSEPRQAIISRKLPVVMLDYSNMQDPDGAVLKLREEIMTNAYDLQRKSIFQLYCVKKSADSCYLLTVCHHALVDGWCMDIYLGSMFQFIDEELTGRYTEDAEPADGDYETAIREIYDKDKNEALEYWRKLLDDYNTRTEIPSYGDVPEAEQSQADDLITVIDKETTDKLIELCKQEKATISNGLELVWGLLLQTYSRTDDAVFVKVVSGRDNTETDVSNLVGLFVNSIPVRVKQDKDATARTMLQVLQKQSSESNAYDFCSLSEIQQQSELGTQLFQTVFTFENYNSGAEDTESIFSFDINLLYYKDENFGAIDPIIGINSKGEIQLRLSFNKKLYRMNEIQRVAELFKVLLTGIVQNPDKALSTLPIISKAAEKEILSLSAGEIYDYNKTVTWIDVFNSVAAEKPDNIAVMDINGSITYSQLRIYSNAFARYLMDNGVQTGDFIAVRMERSYNFEIAVQGIHRAGASYVPIDMDYPQERIDYILEDSGAKMEITSICCTDNKLLINGNIEISAEAAEEVNRSSPDGLSYMIYTSGSTGKPKGVMMLHSGMLNFVHYVRETCHLNENSRITCHSNFAFDVSVESLYPALTAGGAVFIVPEEARKDVAAMRKLIKDYGITGGGYSTAVGQLLGADYTLDVEYINLAGERMTIVPECTGAVINGYGPTETCYCTYYELDKSRDYSAGIPIGRPLYNLTGFIVDQYNRLVPRGVTGELCIAGPQVARGYWNRPDLTAEKFTMLNDSHQIRVYHTGDLCRYNEEGQLEYQGRIDFQVKLSGFRIELGEVDNCAARYQNIGQVITQIKNSQLVLYYTSSEKIDSELLKSFMAESLAEYMVPAIFIQLDEMPMTPNGKIDRRRLPEPEQNYGEIVVPATEIEEKTLKLVEGFLNKEGFGVTTSLLSLGLSSLGAMRLSIVLSKEFAVDIKVSQIMKTPTIRSLAKLISADDTEQKQIEHVADREYYPITENQRGIYIDWEMNRDTTQYNVPGAYKLANKNPEKLAEAIKAAINAHSVLKTRFVLVNGDIMQQSHADEVPEVSVTYLENEPAAEFFQSRVKPFDLQNDRLYRAEVYSYGENTYLFLDIHHTLYDGLSTSVFMGDILSVCDGKKATAEEITAYDFAVYENELINSDKYSKAEGHYDELVSDASAISYPNSKEPDGSVIGNVEARISSKEIDKAAARAGVTVSSFLHATFAEVMSRITREENPLYLTISNGREADTRLADCVGMFVKTLPVVLRTENHGKESVAEFVKSFHNSLQSNIENDFYPYTRIVEKHGIKGEVMFVYQGGLLEGDSIDDVEALPIALDTGKFPVNVVSYPSDDSYVIHIEYDGKRYSQRDMQLLADAIVNTALSMTVTEMISDVEMVSADEKNNLLTISQGEALEYDVTKTWLSMFAEQVNKQPEALAVVDKDSSYTYKELDMVSNKIAAYLIGRGVEVDDFVAVKMHRVKEYVSAVIGIQKAGAAFVPVDLAYPADRIEYMLENANAKIVLDEAEVEKIAGSDISAEAVDKSKPENRAYMIYTSGSTGRPKGVVLHQRGLMNFTKGIAAMFELTSEDRISSHRSFSFDAHIGDFYPTLSVGASVHIMPEEIRKDLDQIYNFLIDHEITGGGYTTSIANLLLTNYDLKQRFISCGGEALRGVQSDKVQIYNEYGPTECNDDVTVCKLELGRHYETVPVGRPMPNSYCFIVDKHNKLVPQGISGEICYAGPQVGYGYWKLDDKTKEVFEDCPFIEGSKMYHTGDIGCYNVEGNIEYIGRVDFQVKLNGFRIELGEIESKALQYEGISQVSAQVRKSQICLYYTASSEVDEATLKSFLSESLAEYMVPHVFMKLETMPMTPNGKVDRKALPDPVLSDKTNDDTQYETELERKLLAIAKEQLKNEGIGVNSNLISMGMSSLAAMRFVVAIRSKLELQVKVADLMKTPTVRSIARMFEKPAGYVDTKMLEDVSSAVKLLKLYMKGKLQADEAIKKAYEMLDGYADEARETLQHYPEQEYYPITENQRGIYIDWEMNRDTTQYNMPSVYKFTGWNAEKLSEAVKAAINAHSVLKTRFAMANGDVMQQPHADEQAYIKVTSLNAEPNVEFFQQRVKPFDLFEDKLYRIEIYSCGNTVYMFKDIHHILYDGLSDGVFMGDILAAYEGREVTEEKITAYDFAIYEKELADSDEYIKAENYYNTLVTDAVAASYPDSESVDGNSTDTVEVRIAAEQIDEICAKHGITASSYMNAAFAEAIQRITREEHLMYLTISNGREAAAELSDCVGMFVKTLPVVLHANKFKNASVSEYVKSFHNQLQNNIENAFYPYTKIVEKYGLHGEIMFLYQGGMVSGDVSEDIEQIYLTLDTTKMPITVTTYPYDGKYVISIEYNGNRYGKADMQLLAEAVGNTAVNMAKVATMKEVSILSAEKQSEVLVISAGKKLEYNSAETWIDMFNRQALIHGNSIAVTDGDGSLTYAELAEKSNAVAAYLVKNGVKPNDFVAIKMHRVKEFMVAVIGIQKAGAAYVPVDPEYPADRVAYMLENSEARFVVTENLLAELSGTGIKEFASLAKPENFAYMIYTSGSTGKPKGVVQSHASLMAFTAWRISELGITSESRHAQHASFSFDASLDDLISPLAAGAQVHIFSDTMRKDIEGMYQYIKDNGITGLTMPTQLGMTLLNQYPDMPLKFFMMGGEKMLPFAKTDIKVINGYGPTEFTVCSSFHVVDQENDKDIPIGRPVPNTYSFICDRFGNLLPEGTVGELCLCGPQLSNGYWNLPEKTAEVFVDCPFMPGMKMYRTGDLARYNENGELEYSGRIDFQVKLRGFRIELGEVENRAASYEGINMVIAQVKKDQLVLYYTVEGNVDKTVLKNYMAEALTEYMVPSVYMQLDEMPMTSGGKIDRKALPEPVLTSSAKYVAPESEAEVAIAAAMQKILGMEAAVGALDSFIELGGDSIKAIRMVSLLRQKKFNIQVADIMKLKTVRKIAAVISDNIIEIDQKPFEGEIKDSAIVAFFKHLNLPEANHFNQSTKLKLRERADVELLQQAVNAVTYQHDMLRAVLKNGVLLVRPADIVIPVVEYTIDDLSETENICMGIQSEIQMSEALVKVALFHGTEADYLFITAHHLVVDGVSWRIINSDLEMAYSQLLKGDKVDLPLKTSTYNDYVEALYKYRNSYQLSLEIPYWKKVQARLLSGNTSMEKDYSRQMSKIAAYLDAESTRKFVRANAGIINADINDTLLTALCRSYSKATGEKTVSIQFEGHGREDIGSNIVIDRTVGWFTSVYPIVVNMIGGDIHDDLINVKEIMHRLPNKGVGYNVLRFLDGEEKTDFINDRIAKIGFNYLGEMDGEQKSDSFFAPTGDINTGEDFSAKNKFGNDISINCSVVNGVFGVSFNYNNDIMEEAKAQEILNGMLSEMKTIAAYLAECRVKEETASDLGENEWSVEEFNNVAAEFAARGEKISRIYPLTPMQEGMLLKHIAEPESWGYRLVNVFEIDKLLTEAQLRNVLTRLGKKHEVLRTAIIHEGVVQPRQAIIERQLSLRMLDYSHEENQEKAVRAYREDVLTNAYDLQRKPLFQLTCIKKSVDSCYLVVATHHAIVDGWCIRLYEGDLFKYINEELTGNIVEDLATEPGIYEEAVREILSKDKKAGLSYWRELLSGYDNRAEIPSAGDIPDEEQDANDELTDYVDIATSEKFIALCKDEQVTTSNGLELAWGMLLQSYCRTSDAVFAKVVSGRDNTKVDVNSVVGLFINSVPVRVKTDTGTTVRQALQELNKQATESNVYDFCPLAEIQQQSELGGQLYQNVLAFENYGSGADTSDNDNDADNGICYNIKPVASKEENFDELTPSLYMTPDNRIGLHIAYNKKHYRKVEIERVIDTFKIIVEGIASAPDAAVAEIPRISQAQISELIALGTGEKIERDSTESIISIFKGRVAETPDATAVVFKDKSYTYAELDRITDNLAVYLKKNYDIKAEENVGVLINRSELMLIYPLAIMKNGAAYMPLDPHFPTDRLAFMCDDASVKVILSEDNLLEEKLPEFAGNRFNSSELYNIPEVSTEETAGLAGPQPSNRMVVLFTSGSTGVPKAVELEHHSIANFCHWYARDFELTAADRVSAYANFGFDAHMMDIYPAIFAGATIYILSDDIRKDLQMVNEYMEKEGITVAFFTTQVGCLIKDMNKTLRFIGVGGERLPLTTAPAYRMANLYGPTECSIAATASDVKGTTDGTYIGRPLANSQLYVVDQNCQLVPKGASGELLICGDGVGRGYMNRPELTAEKFIMFKATADSEPVRAYRSGDLVRWAENNNIQYLGRIDKQVKLRGLRIELGEIENRAASFSGIKQVAVDVKKDQLCCYYVAETEIDKSALKAHLAETLTEFMVPEIYMQLEVMPLNANGKVDRRALPEPEVKLDEIIAPATELEENIFAVVAEIIRTDNFGVTNNLISLGLSSLAAMRLSAAINAKLNLNVKVTEIMRNPTVRGIAGLFNETVPEVDMDTTVLDDVYRLLREYKSGKIKSYDALEQLCHIFPGYADSKDKSEIGIKHVADREYYPITENQRGIYIDWEMNRDTTQYNIPSVYKFTNRNAEKLAEAIKATINAHSVLKTRFALVDNEVMQQARYDEEPQVLLTNLTSEPDVTFFQSRVKPFDLFNDTPYRAEIYTYGETVYMFWDVHHNFFDGLSNGVFIRDVFAAYDGKQLKTEEITAHDFAVYEKELADSEEYAKAEAYYDSLVAGANAASYADSKQADGNSTVNVYSSVAAKDIDAVCTRNGITVSSYLNAAFAEALSRITREENPMYLTISNGRETDIRLSECVGMFVKTLPVVLRTEGHANERTADFLKNFHGQLQDTIANDFYPYTQIVEKYGIHGEIMFVYQGGLANESNSGNSDIENITLSLDATKLPITVTVYPAEDSYIFNFEYDGNRYGKSDIKTLANAVVNAASSMVKAERVKDISILSEEARKSIIQLSAGEKISYNTDETWLDMFKAQVMAHGDSLAVADSASCMTYAELDRKSDSVAAYLAGHGVNANDFVAVKMSRIKEFVVAVLGINKVGAAYIPVDPEYPDERIAYMIEDSEAKVVITDELIREAINTKTDGFKIIAKSENLAYMIYTSGSTGKPKGAMISHRNFRNFVEWNNRTFGQCHGTSHMVHASFSFDASIFDMLCPLAAGASVHIANEEMRHDMTVMANYINENNITGMLVTTQVGMALLNGYDVHLKYLTLGGEKMLPVKKTGIQVYNAYGPTEFTAASSFHKVTGDESEIPIGRPVPNTYSFICDTTGNLVPQGIAGELCLAGVQVGAGYWKLPEKTAEVFVDCPFIPGMKMYRTGDLARYNENGALEYMGRIDFQVKLRGFRIELGEIESRAASYELIHQANAQVKRDQLVLYYTAETEVDKAALKAFMAEKLTEYMVPTVYMQLDKMPMTPGGKIDRKALPEPAFVRSTEYVAPETETEIAIAEAMQKILGISESIGALDNFLEMGGDSIKAIRMVSLLRQSEINIQVADIMKLKTVRKIAEAAANDVLVISQEPFEGMIKDSAIVGFFKHVDMPVPYHFNQSTKLKLKERADVALLQKAMNAITYQHDMLRAVWKDEGLFVRPADTVIPVVEYTISELSESYDIGSKLQSGINMTEELVKIALFHAPEADYLLIVAHHLIVDGVSWRIITTDLEMAYNQLLKGDNVVLPLKTSTYNDYAETVHKYRNSYVLGLEIPYWDDVQKKLLSGHTSIENDYSRQMDGMMGNLNSEDTGNFIKARFGLLNIDVNDALLTAVCRSYNKLTGETNVSIQFEGHGREDINGEIITDRTVGWFTSIYPVVVAGVSGDIRKDLLNVKETMHRLPNKGVGYNILRFIDGETKTDFTDHRIAKIGFNYLGEMDGERNSDSFFMSTDDINAGPDFSGSNVFGTDISINCLVMNHEFTASLMYNTNTITKADAQKFLDGVLDEMKSISGYLAECDEPAETASDLGETEWSAEEFDKVVDEFALRHEKITRIYPLTSMQEAMLLQHMSAPNAGAYKLISIYGIDKMLTSEQLERALARLGRKHEVLRTAIIHEGVSYPRQAIVERKISLEMLDYSNRDNPEKAVMAYREQLLNTPFDLQRESLLKVSCIKTGDDSCCLLISVHHIIVDGWCMGTCTANLFGFIYEEYTGKRTVDPEPENGVYEEAVREICRKDKNAAKMYWRDLLADYENKAEIPSTGMVPAEEQSEVDEALGYVDADTSKKLTELCKSEQATINNGIELAWGLVLQTYSHTDDAVFAKVVSGRDNTKTDVSNVFGLFINSVPVRVKSDKTSTARQLLQRLQKQSADSNEFDFCPLSEIQQQTDLGNQLFQTVIAFENYNSGVKELQETDTKDNSTEAAFNVSSLLVKEENFAEINPSMFITDDNKLALRIYFNKKLYRMEEIEKVIELFRVIVTGIAENPDIAVATLPRLSKASLEKTIALSKGDELEYNQSETWIDMFKAQAVVRGESIAVVDGVGNFTYTELDKQSDKVASYLVNNGVKANDFVAIKMGRVKEFVVAVLGINKAGAAYVPIDSEYPEERIAYMVEDSQASIILDEAIVNEIMKKESTSFVTSVKSDDNAYMIYTSGSTGKPKGVVIKHRGIMACAAWQIPVFGLQAGKQNLHHPSFSFDASTFDLFYPLAAGATVHILGEEIRKDTEAIAEYIRNNNITGMTTSTAIGMVLLNQYNINMDYIMLGGEKFMPVNRTATKLFNGYGPTEFTVCSSFHVIDQENDKDIPIGRPVPNTYSFICDSNGNLLPAGVKGELCLAGPQISSGYWNLPEKTAEVFVDCPFMPGMKMYRTGDLARYNANNELEYLGRIDFQVKLRGFRIELGEVENRATAFAGIKQVSAQVRMDQLVLYYTADTNIDKTMLKSFMAETLTEYMVPTVFMQLEEMPMTPGGKIDRRALPEPVIRVGKIVKPANPVEEQLLEIAQELLPNVEFGVTDDLMSIGMSSLGVMKFVTRISTINSRIRVPDVMRYRNIRAIINGTIRCAWIYDNYDPEKPVLVFVHGIVAVSVTIPKFMEWRKHFNIMAIEPIDEHYHQLFDGENFDEVVTFYNLLLEVNLPAGAKIYAFMGFSYGGEIAMYMARKWHQDTGENIPAIIGDSYFVVDRSHNKNILAENISQRDMDKYNGRVSAREMAYKYKITGLLEVKPRTVLGHHDGKVVYLKAGVPLIDTEQMHEATEDNMEFLQSVLPNLEVVDVPGKNHDDLFVDQSLIGMYTNILLRLKD